MVSFGSRIILLWESLGCKIFINNLLTHLFLVSLLFTYLFSEWFVKRLGPPREKILSCLGSSVKVFIQTIKSILISDNRVTHGIRLHIKSITPSSRPLTGGDPCRFSLRESSDIFISSLTPSWEKVGIPFHGGCQTEKVRIPFHGGGRNKG